VARPSKVILHCVNQNPGGAFKMIITVEDKEEQITSEPAARPLIASWNAVYAIALAVSGLITSEFLPVSLLTPMAQDLNVSEGVSGQAISVTAVVAMVSSLLVAAVTQRQNRRSVLLGFAILQIVSNLLVAFAPNFAVLLAGRVLLGIGLGGFWSMLAATAMRLVPAEKVAKALGIIYAAVSVATVVAAPLGSYLGTLIGWRNVFLIAAALGLLAFLWQLASLPSMPTGKPAKLSTLLQVLKRAEFRKGTLATMFAFMAYASFFTYLRPFLESVTGVDPNTLSIILMGFGIANFFGATIARFLLGWNIHRTLILMPFIMGMAAGGTVLFGHNLYAASGLVAIWGMALGVIQLGWTAWLTKTVPDEVESAGGIQIATIQLAITIGAAAGGFFFDITGANGVFIAGSAIAFAAALVAFLAFKTKLNRHLYEKTGM
jgi:predicted MFS family arabinose efflux permease